MHHSIKKSVPVLFLLLCIELVLASCGKNTASTPGAAGSNTSLGTGMTPEPGTDGRPLPQPHGHVEAMAASNGLVYAESDNGVLYAFDAKSGSLRWQHSLQNTVAVQAVINGVVYAYADGDNRALFYEQARAKGEKPTWTTMGQESAFAQAHTLLVATGYNNALTWQQQLRAVSGVMQVVR